MLLRTMKLGEIKIKKKSQNLIIKTKKIIINLYFFFHTSYNVNVAQIRKKIN